MSRNRNNSVILNNSGLRGDDGLAVVQRSHLIVPDRCDGRRWGWSMCVLVESER